MTTERLSQSRRKGIRTLKQEGEILSRKNWQLLLSEHLETNLGSLGEEGLQAVTVWFTIRSKFSAGVMDEDQFKTLRKEFVGKYDSVIQNGKVSEAIRFITEKTEVTGLTKTTIR